MRKRDSLYFVELSAVELAEHEKVTTNSHKYRGLPRLTTNSLLAIESSKNKKEATKSKWTMKKDLAFCKQARLKTISEKNHKTIELSAVELAEHEKVTTNSHKYRGLPRLTTNSLLAIESTKNKRSN